MSDSRSGAGGADAMSESTGEDRVLEIVTKHDCLDLLPMVGIGRIGVVVDGRPEIFPVNYARLGSDIVFMSGEGTKLHAALGSERVVFEVDYANPTYHSGWSVVVKGRAELVTDEHEVARMSHLPLAPWAPGNRHRYVRIVDEEISGRRIVPVHDGRRHRVADPGARGVDAAPEG